MNPEQVAVSGDTICLAFITIEPPEEMSANAGSPNDETSNHHISNEKVQISDDQHELPASSGFPTQLRKAIEQECALLERYTQIEEKTRQTVASQKHLDCEQDVVYAQELKRVSCYIVQAHSLVRGLDLARESVTPYYYQKFLKSIAVRAKERLAHLKAQKEHFEVKLAEPGELPTGGQRLSTAGQSEDIERMGQFGKPDSHEDNGLLEDLDWSGGGVPQSTGNRAQVNPKNG